MTVAPIVSKMPIISNMNPNMSVGQYLPVDSLGAVFPPQVLSNDASVLGATNTIESNFDFNNLGNSYEYNYGDIGSLNSSNISTQLFSLPQNNIFANYQPILFDFSQYANINANWGFLSKRDEYFQKLKNINTEFKVSKVSLSEAIGSGLKFVSQKHKDRWDNMEAKMQNELIKLADYAKSKGITIYINSSVRTESEQQELVKNGAPAAKKGSKHLTGRAVDIKVSGDKDKNLAILGKYWRDKLGHRWGQDFKHPQPEPWHFDIE